MSFSSMSPFSLRRPPRTKKFDQKAPKITPRALPKAPQSSPGASKGSPGASQETPKTTPERSKQTFGRPGGLSGCFRASQASFLSLRDLFVCCFCAVSVPQNSMVSFLFFSLLFSLFSRPSAQGPGSKVEGSGSRV